MGSPKEIALADYKLPQTRDITSLSSVGGRYHAVLFTAYDVKTRRPTHGIDWRSRKAFQPDAEFQAAVRAAGGTIELVHVYPKREGEIRISYLKESASK